MDKAAQYEQAAALYKQAVAEGADEAEARAAYDAAVSRIAAMPDAPAQAQEGAANASGSPETPQNESGVLSGIKDAARGVARMAGSMSPLAMIGREVGQNKTARGAISTAVQGATFGLADEALGAIDPSKQEMMRSDVADFAKANPGTAFGLNVAGGMAAGAGLKSLAGAGVPLASKAAALLNNSAAAQGALAGFGMSEGDVGDRLGGAVGGGIVGGAIGGLAGAVSGKAAQALARRREGTRQPTLAAQRALTALAKRVEESQIGTDALAEAGAKNAAQGARLVDNMGVVGERAARGVRTLGGSAGEKIDDAMMARLRQYPERVVDALYTGRSIENIIETTDDMVKARQEAARPLYERFRQQPSASVPEIDNLLKRPLFKKAVALANDYQANTGKSLPKIALPEGDTRTLYSPEYLDNIKKSLDDIIFKGRQPGEGGMGPGAMAQAKELRAEFVNVLDKVFPDYAAARNAWAGPTALKEALEDGVEAARSKVSPEELAKDVARLSDSEREMFQRGFLDKLRQVANEGGLKPATTEGRNFIKRIEVAFGDDAGALLSRLRDEVAAQRTATNITKGSITASAANDIFDELNPQNAGVARSLFTRAGRANLVDKLVERGTTPFLKSTREEMANLLLSPADDAEVLKKIAGEIKARGQYGPVSRQVKPTGAAALETSYGFFRGPRDEQGNRR